MEGGGSDLLGPPPTRVQAAAPPTPSSPSCNSGAFCSAGAAPCPWGGVLGVSGGARGDFGVPPGAVSGDAAHVLGAVREALQHHPPARGEPGPAVARRGGGHVAVLHGGRLFRVPVTRGGRLLPPPGAAEPVPGGAGRGGGGPPQPPQETPGVLTAGERPPWAWVRAALQAGGANAAALRGAGRSPLRRRPRPPPGDGDPPGTPRDGDLDAEAKALLHGPCHNRWFDKSLTLIVFSTGRMGLNAEHSWGAPVVGHLWEYTLATDVLELGYEASGDCRGGGEPGIPPPQRLHWDIPPECRGALAGALGAARALAADLQLHVFAFAPPPGPPRPPPAPDALVQLALQLALVRERGPCLSYEAVPTRLFLEGRAEGLRGCGPPSWRSPAAMADPRAGRARRRSLLGAALRGQRGQRRAAMTGAGLDRHLHALAATARQLRLRPPFLAEVLGQPWALSSSPAPRAQPPILPPPCTPRGGASARPTPTVTASPTRGGGTTPSSSTSPAKPPAPARTPDALLVRSGRHWGNWGSCWGGTRSEGGGPRYWTSPPPPPKIKSWDPQGCGRLCWGGPGGYWGGTGGVLGLLGLLEGTGRALGGYWS
ncbi:LOW QUALITY PROTEIN: carnitine O-palmitoyltransferase 1, muscle isoform-like [Morphnus guianensis]